MSDRTIRVEHMKKTYPGDVTAVADVSLNVDSGQIFGFLGPNGAGKSTLVKILTTLALPTSGSARVGGYDVIEEAGDVRRISGVALQEIGLDPLMKPLELLTLQGQLFNMRTADAKKR
ncbi:MAG TPA: ATP-binding cassette domain-containing protein, partial [Anaerolineales bacterium]|nr:ATP-binding cassette domain-containing protein [Anaerolineales bacterium]